MSIMSLEGMSQLKALPLLILFVNLTIMIQKKEIISDERKTGDLKNLGNLLMSLTGKMIGKKAFVEADVIANWKNIAGEELSAFSAPLRIDFKKGEKINGTLWVETIGGAFALEMQSKSKMIIEKVNVFFGYSAVENIKFVQNPQMITDDFYDVQVDEKILVTNEEENYINELCRGIKNPDLENAVRRLGKAFIVNKKSDGV